ncbi:MAG: hypothetical protein HGA61_03950 [Candidatus Moranbacteria bacterium]|nr:hypothetical protein [Candidatus Moranbacteria bacterium]
MKKKFIYIGMFFLAILLQMSFLPVVSGEKVFGDVVLMFVLSLAILEGFDSVFFWIIIGGIFYDLVSYATVGQYVVVFSFVVYMVSFFSRRLSVEIKGMGILFLVLFVVVATFVSDLFFLVMPGFSARPLDLFGQAFGGFRFFFLQIFFNAVFFFTWFCIVRKLKKIS